MTGVLQTSRRVALTLALAAALFVGVGATTGGKLIPSAHAAPAPKTSVSPNGWIPCGNTTWQYEGSSTADGVYWMTISGYFLVDATDNTYFCNQAKAQFHLWPSVCANYSLSTNVSNWQAGGSTCSEIYIWSQPGYLADGATLNAHANLGGNVLTYAATAP